MSRNPAPKNRGLAILSLCAAGLLSASLASCGSPEIDGAAAPDARVVSAHTEGLVAVDARVRVVLASDAPGAAPGVAVEGAFAFDPPIAGRAVWEDSRTIEFTPERKLDSGAAWKGRFDPAAAGLEGAAFGFSFRTAPASVFVELEPPRAAVSGGLELAGRVSANVAPDAAEFERLLSLRGAGDAVIEWGEVEGGSRSFVITGIEAREAASDIRVAWDGRSLGARDRGETRVRLPAAGEFAMTGSRFALEPDRRLELAFSKPLDPSQDLRGLVVPTGFAPGSGPAPSDLRFEREGGLLKVYASLSWPEGASVRVEPGLRSADGDVIAVPVQAAVSAPWDKPEVRFAGSGVIIPSAGGTVLPLETRNVSGLIVEAFRVYDDNMIQFLQVNDLSGGRELRRVGESVWSARVELDWNEGMKNRWVARGLDLAALGARFGKGMYQIRVSFRKDQSRYVCAIDHDFSKLPWPDDRIPELDGDGDSSFWDWAEQWAGGGDPYRYRTDPCHPAYYVRVYDHDITVRRNVLISDLALVMRREADDSWRAAATNLASAAPVAGAEVVLWSYAQRELARAKTDAKGFARLAPPEGSKPAFAELRSGGMSTWMKVDSGAALSTSHFDSGGEKAASGVKGYIYGERGVWRPGDAMHLVFILHDPLKVLPAGHPVSFDLVSPTGAVVRSEVLRSPVDGFWRVDASTAPDAQTGDWRATFTAGGRSWTKVLKVEAVMPNRLKATLDTGGAAALSPAVSELGVSSAWLHGAPADGLLADVSVAFAPQPTVFTSYSGYVFDDPTRRVSASDPRKIWEGRLDAEGEARFRADLSPEGVAPGRLRASFLTRVFEPSGVYSSESFSIDYDPYERYVGLKLPKGDAARGMLLTDVDHVAEIVLVDAAGKPVPKATVEVSLHEIRWRWWWEKGEESLAEYARDSSTRRLLSGTVDIADGKGRWTFRLKYPEWGRYLVRVEDRSGGHSTGQVVYIDWPGWAGRARDEAGGSAEMLVLATDKASYKVGEEVSVTFPSNAKGRALVAVEKSGRVLREEWIAGGAETTRFRFKLEGGMAPNVYVHVMFIQEYGQTANSLPIRLYGIVPVMVEDPATVLEPVVQAPEKLRPNEKSSFTVKEASGKAMTYTVAVVDEGLLGLTRHRVTDPRSEFYRKEASLLSTFDMYRYVAGAYPGKLETLLAIGGGDGFDGKEGRKPERFPAVVRYYGPFRLAAGASAAHELELGSYIGAVRYMVTAGTPSGAYGAAERTATVSSELMVFGTAPRFLSVNETAKLPATLFAGAGRAMRVTVRARAEGAVAIDGPSTVTVDAPRDGEYSAAFAVKTGGSVGSGRIVLTAEGGGFRSEHVIELPVRSASTTVAVDSSFKLDGGTTRSEKLDFPGVPGSNSLTVELSRARPVDLTGRLAFLVGYPHGCAEQTTSKAFPQVFLPEAVEMDAERLVQVRENVAAAIEKLKGFQTPRGGFSFWPGEGVEHDWLSSYVGHFLVSARRAGWNVPADMETRLLEYLARDAALWNSSDPASALVQAYRLYVLALAGKPDLASMNRLREGRELPTQAAWRLAAAWALAGRKDAAASMTRGLMASRTDLEGGGSWGSAFRDDALILDALNALGDSARGKPLFESMADRMASDGWLSTQETAFALVAVLPWIKEAAEGGSSRVRVSFAGGAESTVVLEKGVRQLSVPVSAATGGALRVVNEGKGAVWVRAVARGEPEPGKEGAVSNGLSLEVAWRDASGARIEPESLRLGDDATITARVGNLTFKALSDIALTLRIPAGFEIVNERLADSASSPKAAYRYQDIRDDRSMWYFDLKRGESRTFELRVTRAYDGTFAMPATTAELMYDGSINAVAPGGVVGPVTGSRAAPASTGPVKPASSRPTP